MPLTVSVVRFAKIISIFVVSNDLLSLDEHILKVFSHILCRKSDSFNKAKGYSDNTHILCSRVAMHACCVYIPHTIQVWGIVSFIFAWVLSEPPT